jgi:hypothetical protein
VFKKTVGGEKGKEEWRGIGKFMWNLGQY